MPEFKTIDTLKEPVRQSFEDAIRSLNPDTLFIKREANGKYRNIGVEHMWQGYQLGYSKGLLTQSVGNKTK